MRRTLAAILALTLAVQALSASGRPEAVAVLGTLAEYSYNPTWGGSMAADLAGRVTFDDYLEFEPAVQLSTAGVHTAALRARTILPLGKPALTFGALVLMRDYARSGMYDASLGLSAGVRVPHFDGELGMFSRFIDRFGRDQHSADETLCEPYNLLYRLTGFLRGEGSAWNVWLGASNVDMFQTERMWQPIFTLGGKVPVGKRVTATAEAVLKPTGMFHLNAEPYSIAVRAGVTINL